MNKFPDFLLCSLVCRIKRTVTGLLRHSVYQKVEFLSLHLFMLNYLWSIHLLTSYQNPPLCELNVCFIGRRGGYEFMVIY